MDLAAVAAAVVALAAPVDPAAAAVVALAAPADPADPAAAVVAAPAHREAHRAAARPVLAALVVLALVVARALDRHAVSERSDHIGAIRLNHEDQATNNA